MRSRKRYVQRPSGAFKLLVILLYGQFSYMEYIGRDYVELRSIRKLARVLGTQSTNITGWLAYLELTGYIESLQYSENRRQARFRVRAPSNMFLQRRTDV